eukprot:gene2639-2883_t
MAEESSPSLTLPPHIWQLLLPKEHCLVFLNNGIRWDGRGLLERRPLTVRPDVLSSTQQRPLKDPHIIGSAQVQLGGSIVLVAVRVLVAKFASSEISTLDVHRSLKASRSSLGDLVCNISIDHMTSTKSENKEPSVTAVDLQHLLESLFNRGGVLDTNELVIVEGLYSYRLSLDVTVLSAEGNLRDAALLAAIVALSSARLPEAVVQEDTVFINPGGKTRRLTVRPCVPLTLGSIEGKLLLDPTAREEALLTSQCTVVVDPQGSIIYHLSLDGLEVPIAEVLPLACQQLLPQYADFLQVLSSLL